MQPLQSTRCAFSVKYHHPHYPDEVWAADWDWEFPRVWARSWTEKYTIHWYPIAGLDEYARKAILEKFGLWEWQEEFPIEKLLRMSPAELAKIRRQKEKAHALPRLEILSDTIGNYLPAEEFE